MAQMVEVTCSQCGRTFQRKKDKALRYPNSYCNDVCRGIHKRKRLTRICATCGKEYETTSKRILKYCSKACATQGQIGQNRPYMVGRPGATKGLTKENSEMVARKAQAATIPIPPRDQLYKLYVTENQTMKQIASRFGCTHSTVARWIEHHGLTRTRDLLDKGALEILISSGCSYKKIGKMYKCSEYFVGDRARLYKIPRPLPKTKKKALRRGPNWEEQAARARERDQYRCCCCGITQKKLGKTLQVHHIVPFWRYRYIRGKNENYLRANRLSNLITLCGKCHLGVEAAQVSVQLRFALDMPTD